MKLRKKWEKISKALEETKFTVTIKRLSWEFNLCVQKKIDKSNTNLHPPHSVRVTVFLITENY